MGFVPCRMNSGHIICRFRFDNRYTYLFYNRDKQEVVVFHQFKEGFFPAIDKVTDEYMYCMVPYGLLNSVMSDGLLSKDNIDKLKLLNEDSNPCLVMYRFKSNISDSPLILKVRGETKQ